MALEHIPVNQSCQGRRTLATCALVATWWTGPSQRRLFSSVKIRDSNYERWMNGVVHSESNDRLLGYVRSMWHSIYACTGGNEKFRMQVLPGRSGEYLSALHNLSSLTLRLITVEHIRKEGFRTCFSAFRETLTCLSLDTFDTASFSAFVTLVDYFPNITTLELEPAVAPRLDERPVPSFSRPPRGKLFVYQVQPGRLEFFNRFARLDLEYEELIIASRFYFMGKMFAESVLQISPSTIKFLKLARGLRRE